MTGLPELGLLQVPSHVKAEVQQFFELYKSLEAKPGVDKWVKILSWGNRQEALKQLSDSIALYAEKQVSHSKRM